MWVIPQDTTAHISIMVQLSMEQATGIVHGTIPIIIHDLLPGDLVFITIPGLDGDLVLE